MKKVYVYDWFNPSSESERWIGPGNIPVVVPVWVRDIAVEIMVRYRSITCNSWNETDYIGGLKTSGDSYCAFRIFNGGRDKKGRPNRWVLLLVEVDRKPGKADEIISILECDAFRSYVKYALESKALLPRQTPSWESVNVFNETCIPEKETIVGGASSEKAKMYSKSLTSLNQQEGRIWIEKVAETVRVSIYANSTKREKNVSDTSSEVQRSFRGATFMSGEEEVMDRVCSSDENAQNKRRSENPKKGWGMLGIGIFTCIIVAIFFRYSSVFLPNSKGTEEIVPDSRGSLVSRKVLIHETKPMYVFCEKYEQHAIVEDFDVSFLPRNLQFYCPICGLEHKWNPFEKSNGYKFEKYSFSALQEMKKTAQEKSNSAIKPQVPYDSEGKIPVSEFQVLSWTVSFAHCSSESKEISEDDELQKTR